MARVTEAEVRGILPNTSVQDLTPFINSASLIIDKVAATKKGKKLSTSDLKEAELWLAAHFVRIEDPQVARERFEQSEKTYQIGNRQMTGFLSDSYGQVANSITGGILVELDMRKISASAAGGATLE